MTMRANKGNVVRFTSRILQRSGTLTQFCKVTFAGLVTTICEGWEVHQKHLITSMTAFRCIAGRYYYIWSTFLASPLVGIPRYSALFRQYLGKRMYIVFGLGMFAGIAESFGILMFMPLLETLDRVDNQSVSSQELGGISGKLLQGVDALGLPTSPIALLLIVLVFFLLKGAAVFIGQAGAIYLRTRLLEQLKRRLFAAYTRMDYQYYSTRNTGHFSNVLNEQCNRALMAFQQLNKSVTHVINSAVYVSLALVVAWRFGIMAIVFGGGTLLALNTVSKRVRQLSRLSAQENGALAALLIQTLQSFKYLTATNQSAWLGHEVHRSISRLRHYQWRSGMAGAIPESLREPIAVAVIVAIVIVQLVYFEQPLAPILIAIVLFYRAFNALLNMQSAWQTTMEFIGSIELVNAEFIDQASAQEADGIEEVSALTDGIRLDRVDFAYRGANTPIIKNVSLTIPVNQTVALVGPSGAGKSTLVDLIALLLKPKAGEIYLDDLPASSVQLASWRKRIAYVAQDTVMFEGTIAANICLDPDLRDQLEVQVRIREAARRASINSFIESLPEGYETLIGDRGIRLSGGQRQRLFIARELFREPELLILDEATSALDSESEQAIQASIDELKGKTTVIIIAHRLSTIRNADVIHVMEHGRIVESGGFNELLSNTSSRFSALVAAQTY